MTQIDLARVNVTGMAFTLANGQHRTLRNKTGLFYLHADHLGSTMATTNGNGNIVADHGYYAYGRDRRGSELHTAQRFTGQLTDGTGLIYMNARYYDPQLGQFISPDTLVPDATSLMDFNRYAYARGNPMKYNDPTGHCPGGVVNPNRFMWSPCESVGPATKVEAELATADENAAALTQAETVTAPEAPAPSTPLENAVSANDGAVAPDAPPTTEIGESETVGGKTISPERIVYPRGEGASTGAVPKGYVRVSRWVNAQEAEQWIKKGATNIPGNIGGDTKRVYVTTPGAPKPGGTGPIRIDFDVPKETLHIGGRSDWYQIAQPASNIPIFNVSIHYPN